MTQLALEVEERWPTDIGECPMCEARLLQLVCAPERAICSAWRHNVDLETGEIHTLRGIA